MRVYVGSDPNLRGYNRFTTTLAGLPPVFDLDGAGNVTVKMDYRLNSGSGSGDIVVLVPESAFAGYAATDYVYLYSRFGGTFGASGGFEEWAVRTAPPTDFASLSGTVYFDANGNGVRDANSPGVYFDEYGLFGVMITLQGTNDLGQTILLTTTTDANGQYSFANMRPGTYSITQTQPAWFIDGEETVGSLSGEVENDRFFAINLNGVDGTGYDFGEIPLPDEPK